MRRLLWLLLAAAVGLAQAQTNVAPIKEMAQALGIQCANGAVCFRIYDRSDATETCVAASSDRLFHDADCDGTKDTGEDWLDVLGTATSAKFCKYDASGLEIDCASDVDLGTADVTGTLPLARGGTNQTTWTALDCVRVNGAGTALESAGAACGTGGGGGSGEPNYTQALDGDTSTTLTHNLGTNDLIVACYDASDVLVEPDDVTIGASDPWNVTVTFATNQSGRCVVNGSGGARRYGENFTAATVTLAGSEHLIASADVSVTCWDRSAAPSIVRVEPDDVTINESTYDVTVTFTSSITGRCEVH